MHLSRRTDSLALFLEKSAVTEPVGSGVNLPERFADFLFDPKHAKADVLFDDGFGRAAPQARSAPCRRGDRNSSRLLVVRTTVPRLPRRHALNPRVGLLVKGPLPDRKPQLVPVHVPRHVVQHLVRELAGRRIPALPRRRRRRRHGRRAALGPDAGDAGDKRRARPRILLGHPHPHAEDGRQEGGRPSVKSTSASYQRRWSTTAARVSGGGDAPAWSSAAAPGAWVAASRMPPVATAATSAAACVGGAGRRGTMPKKVASSSPSDPASPSRISASEIRSAAAAYALRTWSSAAASRPAIPRTLVRRRAPPGQRAARRSTAARTPGVSAT